MLTAIVLDKLERPLLYLLCLLVERPNIVGECFWVVQLSFFQQIGGCNAVIYYLPVLFKQSLNQTKFMSMILGGVNMIVYSIFATMSRHVKPARENRPNLTQPGLGQVGLA